MVRIRIKGKEFINNVSGVKEFRRVYRNKRGREYILNKNRKRFLK